MPTTYSNGKSSLFKIEIKKDSKAFRYDVTVAVEGKREFLLSKQTDKHLANAQNLACRKIIKTAFDSTNGFGIGVANIDYCYDGRTVLYATKDFKEQKINLKPADLKFGHLEYSIKSELITVTIVPNERVREIDYSSFDGSLMTETDFTTDHSVRSFLELVTSEIPIRSGAFQYVQSGAIFQSKPILQHQLYKKIDPGMKIFDGMQKGVRILDKNTALMVLDLRRSLEFAGYDQKGNLLSLMDIYKLFVPDENDQRRIEKFEKLFRGVKMIISYDTSRTLQFHQMSKKRLDDVSFNVENKSLGQFYQETHNIKLKYLNVPGAQSFDNVKKNFVYPMEVLYILPGQFVSQDKHDLPLENSVKPQERYEFIMNQANMLANGESASFLQKFGIRILADSNNVQIGHRVLPKIRFRHENGAEKQIVPDEKGGFFKDAQYSPMLVSRKLLRNWTVAYEKSNIEFSEIKSFIEKIMGIAKKSGFEIPVPRRPYAITLDELEQIFIDGVAPKEGKDRLQLIIYIGNDDHSHARLKLFEAKYKVLTQQLTPKCLTGQNQTLKNIVLKLNSKCFGLNFLPVFGASMAKLDLEKNPQLLVIGYDVSHPSPASGNEKYQMHQKGIHDLQSLNPSVVGICANKNSHLGSFSGDFFYQESRREEVSAPRLQKAIKDIVICCNKANKTRKPTEIIIIRDGVSEGQYKMVIERELKAILQGCAEGMKSIDENLAEKTPKVTFIVGTKRHSKRFFRIDQDGISNTKAGDVVNGGVTRQDIQEFFLQSHHPIQGTAQLTQYDILKDDLKIGRENLEEFMLLLANMHQLCGCPTSLPLPIYLADESATRGQEVYNQFNYLLNSPDKPAFVRDFVKPDDLNEYFDKLTEEFAYAGSKLAATRIN